MGDSGGAFLDQWSESDYHFLTDCLRNTIRQGGVVYGAFLAGQLKGFVSVEGPPMGSRGQYRDLTSLHVSEELRGRGIAAVYLPSRQIGPKIRRGEVVPLQSFRRRDAGFLPGDGCREAEEYNWSMWKKNRLIASWNISSSRRLRCRDRFCREADGCSFRTKRWGAGERRFCSGRKRRRSKADFAPTWKER